jgi:hypothetical protein
MTEFALDLAMESVRQGKEPSGGKFLDGAAVELRFDFLKFGSQGACPVFGPFDEFFRKGFELRLVELLDGAFVFVAPPDECVAVDFEFFGDVSDTPAF